MSLAVPASFENGGSGASLACTVSGFAAGDLAVVFGFTFGSSAPGAMLVSDSVGGGVNTYNKRRENVWSATFRSIGAMWDSVIVSAPTSITLTQEGTPGGTPYGIVVVRVTGASSSPFDQSNLRSQTADDPTNNSITTTQADEIIICGLCHDGADTTFDPPTSFTMAQEEESNANQGYAVAYRIVTATGTYSPQWVTGASRDYTMTVGSWKADAAYQPRNPAINIQDPALFMKRLRSGISVPKLWVPERPKLALA